MTTFREIAAHSGYDIIFVLALVPVSGNKVRVCYHLCLRRTTEAALALHIISKIARCYFFLLKNNVLHISYHMRHIIITNYQFFSFFETIVNIENTSEHLKFPKCSQRPDVELCYTTTNVCYI